jgi:hypothetical protein
MKYLQPLVTGLDIEPVLAELEANPQLWNQFTLRTAGYAPAHNAVSDIWVRYRDWQEWLKIQREDQDPSGVGAQQLVARFVSEPHESAWYPAIDVLPSLRTLIFELMRHFEVERLGGVLITRIPPGGEVKPHIDRGWHAGHYEKIAVQLKSAPGQTFCFEDGEFECDPGTVYSFYNSVEHWVKNPTELERMTCIICVRRDQHAKPLYGGGGG